MVVVPEVKAQKLIDKKFIRTGRRIKTNVEQPWLELKIAYFFYQRFTLTIANLVLSKVYLAANGLLFPFTDQEKL